MTQTSLSHTTVRAAVKAPPRCYAWLNPEAAMRHALAAFYQTCRYADHTRQHWGDDLSHEEWLNDLVEVFRWRVTVAAADARVIPEAHATKERHYLACYTEASWLEGFREAQAEIAAETRRRSSETVAN